MKKGILSVLIFLLSITAIIAQNYTDRDKFKVGLHGALPIGDAADFSSFGLGLDVAYHYGVSKVFDLGLATGFTNAFGKTENLTQGGITIETEFDNIQFLPVAGVFRIYPTARSRVNFGADVGYAVGINDGNDGGFYYRPILAVDVNRGTEFTASYTGISLDGITWSTVNLGILFSF